MRLSKEIEARIILKKTNLHPKQLQKRFRNFSSGIRSKFLKDNYGCEFCPLNVICPDYPHANGICSERAKSIGFLLKKGKGELIPLLWDEYLRTKIVFDIEEYRLSQNNESPSNLWFKLHRQIVKLLVEIGKRE